MRSTASSAPTPMPCSTFRCTQGRAARGLVCVNHEYFSAELVFAGHRRRGHEGRRAQAPGWQRHPHAVKFMQAAHGVSVMELQRDSRRLDARSHPRYTRRITANTPMEIIGPGARPCAACARTPIRAASACSARSRIAPRARRPGARTSPPKKTSTTISRAAGRIARAHASSAWIDADAPLPAAREQLLRLGLAGSALRCRARAERALPLRLDGGDRSARSELRAAQAHGARPLPARRREHHRRQERPRRRVHGRRREVRVHLQVRDARSRSTRRTRPPTATCSTTAPCMPRASTPTARASGCRWCTTRRAR